MAEALNKKRLNPEDSRLVAASIHGFAAGNYANNKSSGIDA